MSPPTPDSFLWSCFALFFWSGAWLFSGLFPAILTFNFACYLCLPLHSVTYTLLLVCR